MSTPSDPDKATEQLERQRRPGDGLNGCLVYVFSGASAGTSLRLPQGEATLGSGDDCELVVKDSAVSRRHAHVRVADGEVVVEDLGSTNGTFYMGQQIDRVTFRSGARLTLGESVVDILPLSSEVGGLPISTRDSYGELYGASVSMRRLYSLFEMIEKSDAPVLLQGETGTGKELAARAIHDNGLRAEGPFVILDCGAVARELIESELFGHRKGAFTGAASDRAGAFQSANGGTILLDEIGELPLDLQPKLLRVLETGQVRRVGDDQHREVDVRIIAATHRDLEAMARAGEFREDLFFRLAVVQVRMPALRERPEDVGLIAGRMTRQLSGGKTKELPATAQDFFLRYDWPGNVRELRNAVQRILTLGAAELPKTTARMPSDQSTPQSSATYNDTWRDELDADGTPDFKETRKRVLHSFEVAYLTDLLARFDGNISAAARAAGIDRKHIRQLMQKTGLKADDEG